MELFPRIVEGFYSIFIYSISSQNHQGDKMLLVPHKG